MLGLRPPTRGRLLAFAQAVDFTAFCAACFLIVLSKLKRGAGSRRSGGKFFTKLSTESVYERVWVSQVLGAVALCMRCIKGTRGRLRWLGTEP
jgi:hypothetical protein